MIALREMGVERWGEEGDKAPSGQDLGRAVEGEGKEKERRAYLNNKCRESRSARITL